MDLHPRLTGSMRLACTPDRASAGGPAGGRCFTRAVPTGEPGRPADGGERLNGLRARVQATVYVGVHRSAG